MWQRFTEHARKAVFFAQEEAQKHGEPYVLTEHLLLGLVRERGTSAVAVLDTLGIDRVQVVAEVTKQLPHGEKTKNQDMTLTPRAKRVIDLAYDEARTLGHKYIGTEHLLLGLIREGDGLAGRVLAKLGAKLDAAKIEVSLRRPPSPGGRLTSKAEPSKPLSERHVSWRTMAEDARASIGHAHEAILNLGGSEVLPEHLLIGVLYVEESPATKILVALNIDCDEVLARVEQMLPASASKGTPEVVLSSAGRKIIDTAYAEAVAMEATLVRTEHFLLALGSDKVSPTGKLLAELGFDLDAARAEAKALHPMPWASGATTAKHDNWLYRGLQYFKRRKRS